MYRYVVLSASITALIIVGLWLLARIKDTKIAKKPFFSTLVILILLTAVFDSLIIMSGIVEYNTEYILGMYVGKAPVEDFFYTLVVVPLTILLWEYMGKHES